MNDHALPAESAEDVVVAEADFIAGQRFFRRAAAS
jgi:hypothetical protein